MRPLRSRPIILAALALAACRDATPTEPAIDPPPPAEPGRVVGVMQLTLTGIGTAGVSATLVPLDAAGAPRLSLGTVPGGTPPGTIHVRRLSASSVDVGTRGAGGQRYLQAVFEVRNADLGGTPYPTPRHNLTFIPVGSVATIPGTPVAAFRRQDGTAADFSIARELIPTGAVALDGQGGLVSQYPDVLQAFTEEEVERLTAPAGVSNRFPYGFVVRSASLAGTRTLPARLGPEEYDGHVTFAYRMPLQAAPQDDPFTIAIMVLAVEDAETRITQSLEEQTPAGQAAFEARAAALGAPVVRLLSDGTYTGGARVERMCGVRVAGTAMSPTSWLDGERGVWSGFTPDPYAVAGSFISRTAAITATFTRCVLGVNSRTFVVTGMQSGRAFPVGGYTGDGTDAVTTPPGRFFPGELVEVTLTRELSQTPRVARFRVASSPALGYFSADSSKRARYSLPGDPSGLALADLNGDGWLDVAVSLWSYRQGIAVYLNDGSGRLKTPIWIRVSEATASVAVGDLDEDGLPDLVTSVLWFGSSVVLVWRGTGGGTFEDPRSYMVGEGPGEVGIADLDGDGHADVAVQTTRGVSILPGTGTGALAPVVEYASTANLYHLATSDVNGDGSLDLVTTYMGTVLLLLNDGRGAFTRREIQTIAGDLAHLELGDVNGDGRPDLVAADAFSDTVRVSLNTGGSTFAPAVNYPAGSAAASLHLADLNGDNWLDVVIGNGYRVRFTVLLNTGGTGFGSPQSHAGMAHVVAAGDVTGDGRLDLVVAGDNYSLSYDVTVHSGLPN